MSAEFLRLGRQFLAVRQTSGERMRGEPRTAEGLA